MKYEEKKLHISKYYAHMMNGMSLTSLDTALEEELKYTRPIDEVRNAIKKSLRDAYQEDFLANLLKSSPLPPQVTTLDNTVVRYLTEEAKEKISAHINLKIKKAMATGMSHEEIAEKYSHPQYYTQEQILERIDAENQKEILIGKQNLFSFKGRIDRKLYGIRLLLAVAAGSIILRIAVNIGNLGAIVFLVLSGIPLLVFLLSQVTRRIRDMGLPTWVVAAIVAICIFIPPLGLIAVLACAIVKSVNGR